MDSESLPASSEPEPDATPDPAASWHGTATLRFRSAAPSSPRAAAPTIHQGYATAPLRLQRAFRRADGRCELPILHTAGGLVGGDRLSLTAHLEAGCRALLTSVAAQKVYGSIGRSRRHPAGCWSRQEICCLLEAGADLEWLPQEVVMFAGALHEQHLIVRLAPGASWLGAEVVRLGRTAAGEGLGAGRWRSHLEVRRLSQLPWPPALVPEPVRRGGGDQGGGSQAVMARHELVDRIELAGEALGDPHGMAGQPVFGSLVWAAPHARPAERMARLLEFCRRDRAGLEGEMACGALEQGLVARYRGPSSTAARSWFVRIWARIRAERGLASPELPRVWPFQEEPWDSRVALDPASADAQR